MRAIPQAVVFDNDGLLLDTEEAWTRAEQARFARLGREFTIEHKRTLIGSSRTLAAVKLEALLERPGKGEELMDELHELVMEEALKGVAPRPGALGLLARLTDAGMALAVASNAEREFFERTLASAGLLHDGPFAAIVSATEIEHPKPAPDIYLEACRRLGAEPAEAVALEDSPIGVTAAAAAGMFVVGVPYFAGTDIPGASMLADSLAAPAVARALGLAAAATRPRMRWMSDALSPPPPSPQAPLQGGCLCGAVRFEVTAPLLSASYCHCTRCQRRTGTGCSANGRVPKAGFRLLQGERQLRSYAPADGKAKLFCATCGSALFSGDPFTDEQVAVRLGTLDGDPGIRPQYRLFVDSAAPWEPLADDGLKRYPGSRDA